MMYPLILGLAADGIAVTLTCRVLGFSKTGPLPVEACPVTDRDWADALLIDVALEVHHDDPEFGYRSITYELADHGIAAGRNRVNRLCTQQRLW